MLRGKKDQEEGGKKRAKIVRHGLTRPTCIESKLEFFQFTPFDSSLFRLRYLTHTFHNALFIGKFQLA